MPYNPKLLIIASLFHLIGDEYGKNRDNQGITTAQEWGRPQ